MTIHTTPRTPLMLTRGSNRNRNKTTINPSSGDIIENTNTSNKFKTKINISKGKEQKKRTELNTHTHTHLTETEIDNLIIRKVLDRLNGNGSNQSLILHGIEKTKS